MTTSSTEITTPKASYYLQMLCKHWSHKLPVEFTPDYGIVPFVDGVCVMQADDDSLLVKIEAHDEGRVRHFETVFVKHLERFANKEVLGDIAWQNAPQAA
jgi:hypothetical protein